MVLLECRDARGLYTVRPCWHALPHCVIVYMVSRDVLFDDSSVCCWSGPNSHRESTYNTKYALPPMTMPPTH